MNRAEYMTALKQALAGFEEELVQEIVADYEEHFRVGAARGKREEDIVAELGSIEDLVRELREMQSMNVVEAAKQEEKRREEKKAEEERKAEQADTDSSSAYQETEEKGKDSYGWNGEDWRALGDTLSATLSAAMKTAGEAVNTASRAVREAIDEMGDIDLEFHVDNGKTNVHIKGKDGEEYHFTENEDAYMEYSESGNASCRRVVVDADIADVTLRAGTEEAPKAGCTHNGSYKDTMRYPFYSYQEGDTFYVGIKKTGQRKSGFFRFGITPEIEINITLPKGVREVEVKTSSGDIYASHLELDVLRLHAQSGDAKAHAIKAVECNVESMSGDAELDEFEGERFLISTMSGDSVLKGVQAKSGVVKSMSGDAQISDAQADSLRLSSMSGDARIEGVRTDDLQLSSMSGDATVREGSGKSLHASSASGDVNIKGSYQNYEVKSQSGDVTVYGRGDADVSAQTTNGDVRIEILSAVLGYEVSANTLGGDIRVSENGHNCRATENSVGAKKKERYVIGGGEKKIYGQSVSGDIIVKLWA